MSIRDFAFHLHARAEFAGAATRMISDLLRFGKTQPAPPTVLDILRDAAFTAVVPIVTLSAFLAYRHLNLPLSSSRDTAALAVPKEEREVIPPISKGEHFKRAFVRYCHFQEGRLRVIKQHVQVARIFRLTTCSRTITIRVVRISTI
jgi:hypothetical protein